MQSLFALLVLASPGLGPPTVGGLAAQSAAPGPRADLVLNMGLDQQNRFADEEQASGYELGRAELSLQSRWDWLRGEFRVETVRSAQPQSLFGVDGNSQVVRARRGWVEAFTDGALFRAEAAVGLLPDPWLSSFENGYDIRDLTPIFPEASGILQPSDLGAFLTLSLWDNRLGLRVATSNGEGLNEVERNDGVDTTVVLYGDPWRGPLFGAPARVRASAFFRDGSLGPGSVQNDRLGGAVVASSRAGSVGALYARADGYAERAARTVDGLEAWVNATFYDTPSACWSKTPTTVLVWAAKTACGSSMPPAR